MTMAQYDDAMKMSPRMTRIASAAAVAMAPAALAGSPVTKKMMEVPLPNMPSSFFANRQNDISALKYSDEGSFPFRRLDYYYIDDLSDYSMRFGTCLRAKVKQNNNDDEVEGNQLFYNGRYHAQYLRYASFHLCKVDSDGDQCGNCDMDTGYVVDLDEFMEASVGHVQNYCGACSDSCRRRLEDEGADEDEEEEAAVQMEVDCDVCVDDCSLLLNDNGNGADEANYLECQEAYEDEDSGLQIYSAPTCGSDGSVVIGLFYDEECTVKKGSAELDKGFEYNTFQTVQSLCSACNNGDDVCEELYQGSAHCVNGYDKYNNNGGDDEDDEGDVDVCKAYEKVTKEWTYYEERKPTYWLPVTIIVVGVLSFCSCKSYMYYIRHRHKVPLSEQGNDEAAGAAGAGGAEGDNAGAMATSGQLA